MTADDPEDWSPRVDEDELRDALEAVDEAAADHNAEYAAGMRNARQLIENRLNGSGS
jgi:hypothetical protein